MHVQDPHFKTSNHRRRIIQTSLLAEYAYCLAVGGMLYTVTDVQELGEWMRAKLDAHPLFERCVFINRIRHTSLPDSSICQATPCTSDISGMQPGMPVCS